MGDDVSCNHSIVGTMDTAPVGLTNLYQNLFMAATD